MAIIDVLYSNLGLGILQFILVIIILFCIWYLYNTMQTDYNNMANIIHQQNEILVEIAKEQGIHTEFDYPKAFQKKIEKNYK